jgi:hypothetical protein
MSIGSDCFFFLSLTRARALFFFCTQFSFGSSFQALCAIDKELQFFSSRSHSRSRSFSLLPLSHNVMKLNSLLDHTPP